MFFTEMQEKLKSVTLTCSMVCLLESTRKTFSVLFPKAKDVQWQLDLFHVLPEAYDEGITVILDD